MKDCLLSDKEINKLICQYILHWESVAEFDSLAYPGYGMKREKIIDFCNNEKFGIQLLRKLNKNHKITYTSTTGMWSIRSRLHKYSNRSKSIAIAVIILLSDKKARRELKKINSKKHYKMYGESKLGGLLKECIFTFVLLALIIFLLSSVVYFTLSILGRIY